MEMLVTLTFFLVGVLVWKYMYISPNYRKRDIPGPKGYPIVGSLFDIKQGRLLDQFYDFARKYGKIFKVKILSAEIVVLNSTDLVDKAFNKQGHIFKNRKKSFVMDYIGLVIANAWYIHHDENIWGDPWTFRSYRFLDDKGRLLPNDHLCMKRFCRFFSNNNDVKTQTFKYDQNTVWLKVSWSTVEVKWDWSIVIETDNTVGCRSVQVDDDVLTVELQLCIENCQLFSQAQITFGGTGDETNRIRLDSSTVQTVLVLSLNTRHHKLLIYRIGRKEPQ